MRALRPLRFAGRGSLLVGCCEVDIRSGLFGGSESEDNALKSVAKRRQSMLLHVAVRKVELAVV